MASSTSGEKRNAASPSSTNEELCSTKRISAASSPEHWGNDRETTPRRIERDSLPAELVNQTNKLVKDCKDLNMEIERNLSATCVLNHKHFMSVQSSRDLAALENAERTLLCSGTDRAIGYFLLGAPVQGRSYKSVVESYRGESTHPRWLFSAIDDEGRIRYFGTVLQKICSQPDSVSVGKGLAEILNHYPGPLDAITTSTFTIPDARSNWRLVFLLQAARVRTAAATARVPVRALAPTLQRQEDYFAWRCTVWTWDPNSNIPVVTHFSITRADVSTHTVADVPDGSLELSYDFGMTWRSKDVLDPAGSMKFQSGITYDLPKDSPPRVPAEAKAMVLLMERLARRVIFEVHGKVKTKKDVEQNVARLVELYGGQHKATKHGQINGFRLHRLHRSSTDRLLKMSPTQAAINAGLKITGSIVLPVVSRYWYRLIIETLNDDYHNTGDFNTSWLAATRTAEATLQSIMEYEPLPARCECGPGAMADGEPHNCPTCGRDVICSARVRDRRGQLGCAHCAAASAISHG